MREFERECGADMTVFHNGHLPINFFASELPPEQQKKLKTYGTKVGRSVLGIRIRFEPVS